MSKQIFRQLSLRLYVGAGDGAPRVAPPRAERLVCFFAKLVSKADYIWDVLAVPGTAGQRAGFAVALKGLCWSCLTQEQTSRLRSQ